MKRLFSALGALLFTSCSLVKMNFGQVNVALNSSPLSCVNGAAALVSTPPGNQTDVSSFQNTLYAQITGALACNSCHSTGPGSGFFATPTASGSLATVNSLGLVSWSNLSASKIVTYAGNNHCGTASCASNSEAMLTALQAWQQAEVSAYTAAGANPCSSGNTTTNPNMINGILVTTAQPYPADIPTIAGTSATNAMADVATMTYPLTNLGFPGATFSIQVQIIQAATPTVPALYRFALPTLTLANTTPVQITELHVFANGVDTGLTSYVHINAAIFETSGVLLSPRFSDSVQAVKPNNADQIQIGFKVLQKTSMPACKNLTLFESNVYGASTSSPGTMQGSCMSCHGSATASSTYPEAYDRFPMDVDASAATLCARALERSTPTDADNSTLVQLPYSALIGPTDATPQPAILNHPVVSGFSASSAGNFEAWISSE